MSQYEDPKAPNFVQRAVAAVPNDLMRDLVADSRRTHYPLADAPPPRPEPEPLSYVEWYTERMGAPASFEKARNYYLTLKSEGKQDLPPVRENPRWVDGKWVDCENAQSQSLAPRRGWVEPAPLKDWKPPGIAVIDRMLDQQDALDRRDLERKLGR